MRETEGAVAPLFWMAGAVMVRGAVHYVPRAVISSRQAVTIARRGQGSVMTNNIRAGKQVATQAYGRGNVTFHNAHRSSPAFRAHFQPTTRGRNESHIFIRR